ncbi:MAG: hypothetical protein A2Y48_09565 [Nitrospirae bacterium RIFCSPLOW2_12_42_9]|nr:MAG: hypothetical protein A2035_02250 [Nitrospirae bacterium GWA2_42_11]OGW54889.1 MAG: hypothetical protein A2Z60_02025 [Nitrospirae bacterium RIFCSPLOWO2_02_42_7]OGW55747.1 MAG: hypothetical protein A3D21_04420 [Nitrospirae bacterium RIFCSPHIGHO2_02_FULL_42_12]OGW57215.1 MAG: hypothetical protein A2Y48_09565 [Nitrospirae bacterium RIFCSPLOW2_12_42_9]HAS16592.1 hypothetical protein [Nitrospiraceae bacterium]
MSNCLVPTELDSTTEVASLEEGLEELREMQEEESGNSVFIPEDVVFEVIVIECADFEEESFH